MAQSVRVFGCDGSSAHRLDDRDTLRSTWFLHFGVWTLLGLSFAVQYYYSAMAFGNTIPLGRALRSALCDWYVLGALFYPTRWLCERFPWRLHPQRVLLHLLLAALFSLVHLVLYILVQGALNPQAFAFRESFSFWFIRRFHGNVFYYATFVVISHAIDYYRRLRERELRASELETRLAQAQLQALRMQLQPHFLFNTLHTISELVHENPELADRTITRLSDLLRTSLHRNSTHEIALKHELEFLEGYLEIERARLGDRLNVVMEIAPEIRDAKVPNLILQPLVENAIRHGIAPFSSPGEIAIRGEQLDGMLRLEVRNTIAGLPTNRAKGLQHGVGLMNTQARLLQMYGPRQSFAAGNDAGRGFVVTLSIPYQTCENAPETPSLREDSHAHH